MRTLLDTGGRLSEVAGLRVDDVDFDLDVLHVIGNGRRGRSVPFGKRTGLALEPLTCALVYATPAETTRAFGSASRVR